MTANRSILEFIKSPATQLFLCGFIVALGGCMLYAIKTTPLKLRCVIDSSYYDIRRDGNVTLTRGVYNTYRDGFNKGHITFIGSIARFNKSGTFTPPVPIHREVSFSALINRNLIQMKVTGHSRRLGDESSDQDITDYVFPQIKMGDTYTTAVYKLDDKVLASGTENVPRSLCNN